MAMEFMSSDESDEEDGTVVLVRRPLPWLSREATEVLASLDRKSARRMSEKSRKMKLRRLTGDFSTARRMPSSAPSSAVTCEM